jgi:hypothetical protein
LISGPVWRGDRGRPGGWGCLEFNDAGYTETPNAAPFQLTTEASWCAWVKRVDVNNNAIVSKRFSEWTLEIEGGLLQFQANRGATATRVRSSSTVSGSQWAHVAVTFSATKTNANGEHHSLYIDGVLQTNAWQEGADSATALTTGTNVVRVGKRSAQDGQEFLGFIDDVRVFGRALSTAEVFALYADSREGHPETLRRLPRPRRYRRSPGGVGLIGPGLVGANPLFTFGGGGLVS